MKKKYDQQESIRLIQEYIDNPNMKTEKALYDQFYRLVKKLAIKIKCFHHSIIDIDLLFNVGMTELFKIIKDYNPELGTLNTYLYKNVYGRMIDEIRHITKVRKIKTVIEKLNIFNNYYYKIFKKHPFKSDYKQYFDKYIYRNNNRTRIKRRCSSSFEISFMIYSNTFYAYSLNQLYNTPKSDIGYAQSKELDLFNIISNEKDMPENIYNSNELINYNEKIIQSLTNREKYVIDQYYFWGLSLKQIGEHLSVTESRVSQILIKIKLKLKHHLLKKYTKKQILEEIC